MRLALASRAALLTAVGWTALAGAAAAQTPQQPADLVDVIVTATPFGVTDRASLLAVEVLSEEDLAAYCKVNFTAYKRPKYIEFRDDLPKTNVGKVLRRELRATAQGLS